MSIATDVYGTDSLYTRTLGSTATWSPNLARAGEYEVFVWYSGSRYGNRDTGAEYTVNHAQGSETVIVNQDQGSGAWVSLGMFSFDAGTAGNVTLACHFEGGDTVIIADAVRFMPISDPVEMIVDNQDAGFTTTGT